MSSKTILMIENFGEDFYKARIPLVKFLQKKGFNITALIPNDGFTERIRNEKIEVYDYPFDRKNKGFLQILYLTFLYRKVIRVQNIDIVHSFRFQPNLVNCIANLFSKTTVICHITGLGIAFSNDSLKFRFLRIVSKVLYLFILLRANTVVVQNPDDIDEFWLSFLFKKKIRLIKGSGVDTDFFVNQDEGNKTDKLIFICVTRLLWEKGIKEMVEAFISLPEKYKTQSILWIIGWADFENPRSVSKEYIEKVSENNNVVFLGKRNDIKQLLQKSDVYIYPSYYREGIPRSILEALAMSLPIITTDMPGCNLTVNSQNGILITPKSVDSIQKGVITILEQKDKLKAMGHISRKMAVDDFSNDSIFSQIELIYDCN